MCIEFDLCLLSFTCDAMQTYFFVFWGFTLIDVCCRSLTVQYSFISLSCDNFVQSMHAVYHPQRNPVLMSAFCVSIFIIICCLSPATQCTLILCPCYHFFIYLFTVYQPRRNPFLSIGLQRISFEMLLSPKSQFICISLPIVDILRCLYYVSHSYCSPVLYRCLHTFSSDLCMLSITSNAILYNSFAFWECIYILVFCPSIKT